MKIIAKTDIGLVRQTNEDNYLVIQKDENNFLAFVCDGMGGHLGGSFASSKTVQMIEEEFNNYQDVERDSFFDLNYIFEDSGATNAADSE